MQKHPECNFLPLRQAARQVTQFYDQYLAPTGIRCTQFTILSYLKRLGPLSINTLSRELVLDRTTLGRTMLPLERDGLIEIGSSPLDRRKKELRITGAGEVRLRQARAQWAIAQEIFESHFGAERSSRLRSELRALIESDFPASNERDSLTVASLSSAAAENHVRSTLR